MVPDCSFDGCSSCGVCGPDLGHNRVVPPPPVPPLSHGGQPPSHRVSRLRCRFAKTGSLALISHLDTLRLLERALRRSELPVSFSGGFHPLPRMQLGLPLPLGAEGCGEWMDLEFAQPVDPAAVRRRLQLELPRDFELESVVAVPVHGPSLSQELVAARWRIELLQEGQALASETMTMAITRLLEAEELIWHDRDKKGRPRQRDCRPYLRDLDRMASGEVAFEAAIDSLGRSLRPEHLQHWLSEASGEALVLGRVSRQELLLRPC